MATHDYNIANASGSAVRTDLNNVLAAIVSNNSNATEPATTFAFQWWADTTAGILKIRNAANDDWIDVIQLDGIFGTLRLADGAEATPSLTFGSDTDVGLYLDAANTIGISANGVKEVEVGETNTTIYNEAKFDAGAQFNTAGINFNFNSDSTSRTITSYTYDCTDTLDNATGTQAARLVLENNGKLSLEHVGGTTTALIRFVGKTTLDSSYRIAQFQGDSDALDVLNHSSGDYKFANSQQSNEIRFNDGTGGVMIFYNGDSSKNLSLGSSGVTSEYIFNTTTGSTSNLLRIGGSSTSYLIYRSTSSNRYKNNIADYTGGLSRIASVTPRTWNDYKTGERCVGFIAEELHAAGYTDAVGYESWTGGSEVGIGDDPSPMTGNGTAPVTKTGEALADEVEVVENISDRTIICDLVLAVQELTARLSALESA